MIRFRSYPSNADGARRRVSIRWRAVEVEVPDHIVAVAPVELLVCDGADFGPVGPAHGCLFHPVAGD
jgi:hypothetical protein